MYKYLFILIFLIILIVKFNFIFTSNEDNLQTARFYHRKSDAVNALKYYHKCIYDKNYFVLIDIADIYHFGLSSFEKNIYLANKYYISFLNIIDILPDSNTIEHRKYKSYVNNKLEQIKIENTCKEISNKKDRIDHNLNDINKYLTENILDGFDKINLFKNQPIVNNIIQNIPIVNNNNIIYNDNIYDPQNVHDTSINKTVKHSIENIQKDAIITYNFNEVIDMFNIEIIKLKLHHNKLSNIKKVIHNIRQFDTKSVYNNMKLTELLILVGNRIF